jgi:hypothetical protein
MIATPSKRKRTNDLTSTDVEDDEIRQVVTALVLPVTPDLVAEVTQRPLEGDQSPRVFARNTAYTPHDRARVLGVMLYAIDLVGGHRDLVLWGTGRATDLARKLPSSGVGHGLRLNDLIDLGIQTATAWTMKAAPASACRAVAEELHYATATCPSLGDLPMYRHALLATWAVASSACDGTPLLFIERGWMGKGARSVEYAPVYLRHLDQLADLIEQRCVDSG